MNIAVISRPKQGFNANGDAYITKTINQQTLISIIDGIGHGPHADKAATKCIDTIKTYIASNKTLKNLNLSELFNKCHEALKSTDGAVMATILIDRENNTINYAGIGNISTRIIGEKTYYPIPRGGIVGYNMPKVKPHNYPYTPGDMILMHSDGIISRINTEILREIKELTEQKIAEKLFEQYSREEDDATLLIAR